MKNKSEIFNITPPNAKDEDKLKKGTQKYQLIQKCINPEWRGFKSSHIMPDKSQKYTSSYAKQPISRSSAGNYSSKRFSAGGYNHQNKKIDPFSQNWTFTSHDSYAEKSEKIAPNKSLWTKMRHHDDGAATQPASLNLADFKEEFYDQSNKTSNAEISKTTKKVFLFL